jgi:hypothetical protein
VGGRGVAALTAPDLSPDALVCRVDRPFDPDPLSSRKLMRPVDLRKGDILLKHDRAVVLSAGWPRRGRGGHVWFVETSQGAMTWPLEDASRFRNLQVHREVAS